MSQKSKPTIHDTLTYPSYTRLDSTYANLRIQYLKNDFPFVPAGRVGINSLKLTSVEDSIAKEIIDGIISWESAHLKLADIYFQKGKYENFITEINVLIEDKPFDKFPYLKALKSLEKIKQIDKQRYLLNRYYKVYPDLYTARKLGDIHFSRSKFREAIYFYRDCLNYSKSDPRIYFNLSASYYGIKDLPRALENIAECLKLDSNYPNAQKIYYELMKIYQKGK